MRLLSSVIMMALATFGTTAATEEDRYQVSLTRKASNLYKADGQPIWIQTRYCYVYAYGEVAALSSDEVVFLNDTEKCDVKRIL